VSKQVFIIVDYVYAFTNNGKDVELTECKIKRVYGSKEDADAYLVRRYRANVNKGLPSNCTRLVTAEEFQIR
jgi:hypothetical protein